MADRIPSNVFIIRAVPTEGGRFYALYSAPGFFPSPAKSKDGTVLEFDNAKDAEHAAALAMVEVLNKPRIKAGQNKGKPERYKKLTGPEFAVALRLAGITPTFFAYLYGTSQERVIKWVDGQEDVPHPARVLLAIFASDQLGIDIAERVTDEVTTSRRPDLRKP